MLPHILFSLFGTHYRIPTSELILAFAIVFAVVTMASALKREIPIAKMIMIVAGTALSTLVGARLFHVIWERPQYFIEHPTHIFSRLDGMTYYGGFLVAVACFSWFLHRYPASVRKKAWDAAAIDTAFLLAIMRVSCFAEGCCWGRPTDVPWAVQYYDPTSTMPWLGIPVHPTQLYEAFGCLVIGGGLIALTRLWKKHRGTLIFFFCALYGVLRYVVEAYRGDAIRGVDVVGGLSTSQVLSIVIGGVGILLLLRNKGQPLPGVNTR